MLYLFKIIPFIFIIFELKILQTVFETINFIDLISKIH